MPLSFVSFFIEIALFVKSLEKFQNNVKVLFIFLSMKQIIDSHTGNFGNIMITKY